MFSGLIETTAYLKESIFSDGCKYFSFVPELSFNDLSLGDSIAVNGVCLSVTAYNAESFSVTAVPETLRRTNLGRLNENDQVNLERSLKFGSRIGGHYVQGHVDDVCMIENIKFDDSTAQLIKLKTAPHLMKYIVNKGYIGLDGMSITIIDTGCDWFTITLIPHTQQVTIAKQYQVGTQINLEVDIMGKYIEKIIGAYQHDNQIRAR